MCTSLAHESLLQHTVLVSEWQIHQTLTATSVLNCFAQSSWPCELLGIISTQFFFTFQCKYCFRYTAAAQKQREAAQASKEKAAAKVEAGRLKRKLMDEAEGLDEGDDEGDDEKVEDETSSGSLPKARKPSVKRAAAIADRVAEDTRKRKALGRCSRFAQLQNAQRTA